MPDQEQEQDPHLALPPSTPLESEEGARTDGPGRGGGVQTITVDNVGIKLDHLGPIIVNTDGTLTRIRNWGKMTEQERNTAMRRIARRNKLRQEQLAGLVEKEAQGERWANERRIGRN